MISTAVEILRRGGLVAFPTETVYGLGADATNAAAVRRVFAAKGRPGTNPLIVHVASVDVACRCAADWPPVADRLAERCWPGPITLVVRKSNVIVAEVTAGGPTVGIRVPNHPVAIDLLRAFGGPIAAPSANRSNHISPTQASHVKAELGDSVDLILDGGPCAVGIESTVLDLSSEQPRILRPGGISQAQIEAIIGPVEVFSGHVGATDVATSPGQQLRHYSPRTPAFRFTAEQWLRLAPRMTSQVAVMGLNADQRLAAAHYVQMPADAGEYARVLYGTLRELDAQGYQAMYVEWPTGDAAWDAVRDRIARATGQIEHG